MRGTWAVNTIASLESFRRFILSTCTIPKKYFKDSKVFLERDSEKSWIYVRSPDKCTISKTQEYTIIFAVDVLDVFYRSKSGHTKLHWCRYHGHDLGRDMGKITGKASSTSILNLVSSGITCINSKRSI